MCLLCGNPHARCSSQEFELQFAPPLLLENALPYPVEAAVWDIEWGTRHVAYIPPGERKGEEGGGGFKVKMVVQCNAAAGMSINDAAVMDRKPVKCSLVCCEELMNLDSCTCEFFNPLTLSQLSANNRAGHISRHADLLIVSPFNPIYSILFHPTPPHPTPPHPIPFHPIPPHSIPSHQANLTPCTTSAWIITWRCSSRCV